MAHWISNQSEDLLSIAIRRRMPHFSLDARFQVLSGRTVLLGPSGAGKSLTLQAIAGLFPLDSAYIARGTTVWHNTSGGIFIPPERRRIGYLPQSYALFPHLSVAQNIAFGQRQRGESARSRVAELIALMQLQGLQHLRPAQLSGGQQQRVALARALASEPRLLLLDEPWSALDAPVRATLRAEILRFYEQFEVPLVLVTHDLSDAQELADTIVILDHGHVLQVGSPEEVFHAPHTRRVAELVGMRTVWSGIVTARHPLNPQHCLTTIQVGDVTLRARVPSMRTPQVRQAVEIGVSTDDISVCPRGEDPAATEPNEQESRTGALVSGIVDQSQNRGTFYSVTVSLTSERHLEIPVPRWQHRTLQITVGMPITLYIPCEAIHVFQSADPLTPTQNPG